jgi:glucosamine-6-phosphate deaminase
MSRATADFIADQITQHPGSLLCFPSGDTPTGTFKLLVDYARSEKIDFSQCRFVGLDEWVGMDRHIPGSCQHYMYAHLFEPLKIPAAHIVFFNARAKDLDAECKRIDQFIFAHGAIDLLVVGVGVNGHVGLNEPGASVNSYSHHIQLEESTKAGAQKYFSGTQILREGITIGIKHMLQAKTAVVMASGEKKASIIQKIIEGPITEQVPGSILQTHKNCHFFLDQDTSRFLSKNKSYFRY